MRSRFVLSIFILLTVSSSASAADYSRHIAIAPFTILGAKEDIRQTVDILPRLVSSRLMAMTGAEVLLIPPGEASPENAAKKAGLPLLLQGSVAKVGAGYSIDVTVKDLATGQPAGAFFTVAATEDEIIPRLADLSADISEKLFGVKAAARAYPTTPPAPPPVSSPAVPAPAPAATQAAVISPPPPAPVSPSPAAAPPASAQAWKPSAMEKIAESGRITDEFHGVVTGDVDSGGNGEVIAYGRKGIHLFRVNGKEIVSAARVTDGVPGHILNVEAVDLDGDGAKELVVTGIDGENLRSTILKKKGDAYGMIADRLPYFLVLLPDWKGKEILAGQQKGDDTPFHGRLYAMFWDGKTLRMGEALPGDTLREPLSSGILGLSSARFGKEWKWIYTDRNDSLRLLSADGGTEYRTGTDFGWSGDSFEWGIYLPRQGKAKYYVRKAARVSLGPDGRPLILVPAAEEGFVNLEFSSKTTRLVLLQWDGGELIESAGTRKGDRVYSAADFLSAPNPNTGGMVIAAIIEQPDGVIKGGISRLALYQIR